MAKKTEETCETCGTPWVVAVPGTERERRFCLAHLPMTVSQLAFLDTPSIVALRKKLKVKIRGDELKTQLRAIGAECLLIGPKKDPA
jgi:hypothetical protein